MLSNWLVTITAPIVKLSKFEDVINYKLLTSDWSLKTGWVRN
jgi:hypothetical protein